MGLARDTADARADVARRICNDMSVQLLAGSLTSIYHSGTLTDFLPEGWSGKDVAADVAAKARTAELFTLTPQMLELVQHAATTLPPQEIDRFDLPSPVGWLHLPEPFTLHGHDMNMAVTDIMWSEQDVGKEGYDYGTARSVVRGIVMHLFVARDDMEAQVRFGDPQAHTAFTVQLPSVYPSMVMSAAFNEMAWAFPDADPWDVPSNLKSIHDGAIVNELGDGRYEVVTSDGEIVTVTPDKIVQFLKTYFHFIQSDITERDEQNLPKAAARAMRKKGLPVGPVSVIRLRRRHATDPTGQKWELDYRYVRRGHWRRQWYGPADNKYQRHIWISPTVVGPDDAPLVIKDTVNLLDR